MPEEVVPRENAYFSFNNVSILSIEVEEAPIVVTSSEIDEQLLATYEEAGLKPGILEGLAGIRQRRWWPEGYTFTEAARRAGEKALIAAGVSGSQIGLLIDTSVCKEHLEPSAAVKIHAELNLSPSCLNFDLSNACLGFMNGVHIAGTMIDAGQINYALIVDGEGSRHTQEVTIKRLSEGTPTASEIIENFATLTLGSGGAAMVIGRSDQHPQGHRVICGMAQAATEYHNLCVGNLEYMRTDARALMDAGVLLSQRAWRECNETYDWSDLQRYFMHQVSNVHTTAIINALNLDPSRVPLTFPEYGNIGPASVPTTLALYQNELVPGDRIGLLGIGSGLNTLALEVKW